MGQSFIKTVQEFSITELTLIIVGLGGMFLVAFGLIREVCKKGNYYNTIYFGLLFALIGIVGNAALRVGREEGYKQGQVDAMKGDWKYTIILEPKFEIRERVIEK